MKIAALAPIEVEILLLFSLKSKRLKRIAGLAPKKIYHRNRNDKTFKILFPKLTDYVFASVSFVLAIFYLKFAQL
jgi:hypothetical protein